MSRIIIGVVLSVCLLAVNTRAAHYAGPLSGDEPARSSEAVQPKEAQTSASSNTPVSKPTQAQSKEEKRVREIKNRLRQMGLAARITVILLNDNERYGSVERIDAESFQLAEVDLKQEVTIEYKNVKKVRTGYGQFNGITGKRVNPKVDLIAKIAILTFLLIIVPLSVPRT
jgi:hypothetical protein